MRKLWPNLSGYSAKAGVPRVRRMATHACRNRLGQAVDLGLFVGNEQSHIDGTTDGLAVASRLGAVFFQNGGLPGEHFRSRPHIPMVGLPGDNAKRDTFAAASDHQF